MTTPTRESAAPSEKLSNKTEPELATEREKVLADMAKLDRELEGIDQRHAAELAKDEPAEKRLEELEEIRERFSRDRLRLKSRLRAIDEILLPAARQKAARLWAEEGEKEYTALAAKVADSLALGREVVAQLGEMLKRIPWSDPNSHPALRMGPLAESVKHAREDAGMEAVEREKIPHAESGQIGAEIRELAKKLADMLYVPHQAGPFSAREKQALRLEQERKREERGRRVEEANAERLPTMPFGPSERVA